MKNSGVVAAITILAMVFALNLLFSETVSSQETVDITLGIDYGNATRTWHPISVQSDATLLNATARVATIGVKDFPGLGVFVDAINDVRSNASHFWLWCYWSEPKSRWIWGPVGASSYVVRDGETLVWFYSSGTENPSPPPNRPQVPCLGSPLAALSVLFVSAVRLRSRWRPKGRNSVRQRPNLLYPG